MTTAKFIIFEDKDRKVFPIIFPDTLVHAEVANAMIRYIEAGTVQGFKPVSVGMCVHDGKRIKVHGESTSLKLKCRKEDDDLIAQYLDL